MMTRTILIVAALLLLTVEAASAKSHHVRRHQVPARVVEPAVYGGTYVLHPAHNIACDTHYRSTRALPCDQPVWVYGNVCEVDLGLGFYRRCE